jgi:hypothetical protein
MQRWRISSSQAETLQKDGSQGKWTDAVEIPLPVAGDLVWAETHWMESNLVEHSVGSKHTIVLHPSTSKYLVATDTKSFKTVDGVWIIKDITSNKSACSCNEVNTMGLRYTQAALCACA